MSKLDDAELSRDAILRGRLHIWQPKSGYRFAVDPLLLAHFVAGGKRAPAKISDLGTGSGILALILAQIFPDAQVTAVELQPRLAALARKNAVDNALADRVRVIELDLADRAQARALPGGEADLVVSNPPYRTVGSGDVNPDPEEAIARHELRLTLPVLVAEARRLVRPEGRCAFVYPVDRLADLLAALAQEKLSVTRLRFAHDQPDAPARRLLLEARKSPRGTLVVEAPLVLRDGDGRFTPEARLALGES